MSLFGLKNNKIDLWICIGQSNMVGQAPQAEFPSAYTGIQYGNIVSSGVEIISLVYSSGVWGCQYTLFKDLANYKRKSILSSNSAVSGSYMNYQAAAADWNIQSLAANGSVKPLNQRLLDSMNANITQLITNLTNKGIDYTIKGVLWCQGESDCDVLADANSYAQNFKDMRAYIRTQYSLPNLPFIIAQTHSNFVPPRTYTNTVRQAQLDNSNQSSNISFYDVNTYIITDTNTYGLNADNVHFNGAGQIAMGNDFLNIIKNL